MNNKKNDGAEICETNLGKKSGKQISEKNPGKKSREKIREKIRKNLKNKHFGTTITAIYFVALPRR